MVISDFRTAGGALRFPRAHNPENAMRLTPRVFFSSVPALLVSALCLILANPAHAQFRGFGAFHPSFQPHYGCFGYCNGPIGQVHTHWGCFGYCNGPINPRPYWGCFGYCPGPLNPHPYHPYWGCFGHCTGPLNPRPYWGCFGY